jgi:site-specific DNA-methyltransferase (adenine-specific)
VGTHIRQRGKEDMIDKALFSHEHDEWETPQWLFDRLDAKYHFEVDAAANSKNTKCRHFYNNSLPLDWTDPTPIGNWRPKLFFLNPPYSQCEEFIKKAFNEGRKGATVVCLIPSRTDTKWWHEFVMRAKAIYFIKGRLKFSNSKNSAPFPSCVVEFGKLDTFYPSDPPYLGTIEK